MEPDECALRCPTVQMMGGQLQAGRGLPREPWGRLGTFAQFPLFPRKHDQLVPGIVPTKQEKVAGPLVRKNLL